MVIGGQNTDFINSLNANREAYNLMRNRGEKIARDFVLLHGLPLTVERYAHCGECYDITILHDEPISVKKVI